MIIELALRFEILPKENKLKDVRLRLPDINTMILVNNNK